jgi:hypothetical protein
MSEAHTSSAQFGECVGSGSVAAPGPAGWLSLGAAPVFALMALWTGLLGQPDTFCMSTHDGSWIDRMALMYALMSVFHAAPWLKVLLTRREAPRI